MCNIKSSSHAPPMIKVNHYTTCGMCLGYQKGVIGCNQSYNLRKIKISSAQLSQSSEQLRIAQITSVQFSLGLSFHDSDGFFLSTLFLFPFCFLFFHYTSPTLSTLFSGGNFYIFQNFKEFFNFFIFLDILIFYFLNLNFLWWDFLIF